MIVFVHIPKTGGGTLRSIVREWYGDAMSHVAIDEGFSEPITDETKVVFGHSAYLALQSEHEHRIERVIAFVREPVERLASHYAYWQSVRPTPASPSLHHHVRAGMPFSEFASEPSMVNLQYRYVAPFTRDYHVELYPSGRHYFNTSLRDLAESIGADLPDYTDVNVTRGDKPFILDRSRLLRLNIDDEILWDDARMSALSREVRP